MPSVDELLDAAEVAEATLTETNDKIEIDADTRTMIIPDTERIFGVMSDEKGERKYFRCKRFVGNGIDLSKLSLRIIFQNASGLDTGRDKYIVTDLATDGEDYVTFSWELSRKVTAYKGIISFIVCAIKTGTDGIITNEWNTTLANGIVLDGLEVSGTQEQEKEAYDYYKQLEAELLRVANEQKTEIEKKAQEVIGTIPSDYIQTLKDVNNLKEEVTDGRTDVDGNVHKNIGDAMRGQVRKLRENLVVMQKEQPTDPNNNVWISDEDDEVEVPDMVEFNSLKEDLGNKTKNLKQWNLIDISKVKEGYGYTNSIGYPPTLVAQTGYNAIDDIIPCEAGETYTVNWLYGAIGIYDSSIKRIQHIYIDSIPKTFVVPDGGCYMTLFGGTKRMVDIMLVEGNEIPDEYIPHSIFDIESKKDYEQDKILESILHPLKGVKWCAYGNSLTDSATLAGQTTGTKNYVDYVSESLGLNVVNCGSGGTGFLKNNNKGTFVDRVSSIPLDTEILTVFGSFNDYEYISEHLGTIGDTGTDTIYGAIYNFIHDVYTRCPNAIIGIITPTKWGYLSDWKDVSAGGLCDSYVEALLKTADKWSIPVLDLYHDSGLRPWDSNFAQLYYKDDDGNGTANTVHPLDAAHKRFIAPKVEAFIKQIYHVY